MGMLSVTIQSVIMSATSNIIAQAITAYRTDVRCHVASSLGESSD